MLLLLDIVSTAAILFIVALGLLAILGVLKIIDFAHGAWLTVGAYCAVLTLGFGRDVQIAPALLAGTGNFGGIEYSAYRLFAILAAVIVGAVYALAFVGTRLGLLARAVIVNETLARALGIDTSRVRLATFMIGTGLAAVAGVLLAPLTSIDPNMGVGWMIVAFMLAMVSGASGLALADASLAFGAVQFLVSA